MNHSIAKIIRLYKELNYRRTLTAVWISQFLGILAFAFGLSGLDVALFCVSLLVGIYVSISSLETKEVGFAIGAIILPVPLVIGTLLSVILILELLLHGTASMLAHGNIFLTTMGVILGAELFILAPLLLGCHAIRLATYRAGILR